jgi:hypothetical protein
MFNLDKFISASVENPHQIDPPFPLVIDPPEFFFSSTIEMQAVRMKNRNSLHSI